MPTTHQPLNTRAAASVRNRTLSHPHTACRHAPARRSGPAPLRVCGPTGNACSRGSAGPWRRWRTPTRAWWRRLQRPPSQPRRRAPLRHRCAAARRQLRPRRSPPSSSSRAPDRVTPRPMHRHGPGRRPTSYRAVLLLQLTCQITSPQLKPFVSLWLPYVSCCERARPASAGQGPSPRFKS